LTSLTIDTILIQAKDGLDVSEPANFLSFRATSNYKMIQGSKTAT